MIFWLHAIQASGNPAKIASFLRCWLEQDNRKALAFVEVEVAYKDERRLVILIAEEEEHEVLAIDRCEFKLLDDDDDDDDDVDEDMSKINCNEFCTISK